MLETPNTSPGPDPFLSRRRGAPASVPRSRSRHPGDSLKGCGPDELFEIGDVVVTKRQVRRQALEPARLPDVRTRTRLDGRGLADELREVAVTHPASIGKSLLENASEDRL